MSSHYNIINFLEEHRVEKGCEHTHMSMGKPYGSFMIPDDEYSIFLELYQKAILNNNMLFLIEKHKEYSPIIIDFDFKFDLNVQGRQYTDKHIEDIVKLYFDEIVDIFNIENNSDKLKAFIFEKKEAYNIKNCIKDGIHIMFPYIISTPDIQYYIRENILKKIPDVLSDLNLTNKYHDVVDRSIIYKNGWFLYGSTKPNSDIYKLTKIIDNNNNYININNYKFGTENLAEFFSIRNKNKTTPIHDNKKNLIEKSNIKVIKKNTKKLSIIKDINIDQLGAIVLNISDSRADDYQSWIDIGLALHNIDSNNDQLLNIWKEFSKKSTKYTEGVCEKYWNSMESLKGGLSIGSIYYWSKISNYEKYQEIKRSDIQYWINQSINTVTNWDIAKVLYEMYKFEFVCSSPKNKVWYQFKNHKYQEIDDGIALRQKISTELCMEYIYLISNYNKNLSSDDDICEEDKEAIKKKCKTLTEIVVKLKTTSFKDNVIKECRELFYQEDFENKLDTNPYLIGFTNGVYDLNKMEFRDGTPDDYISLSTGIEYIAFDYYDDNFKEMESFINKIFPNKDVKEYVLTFLSTCLQGVNAEEKFRIWTGSGSNGKSKLEELFLNSFGEYCIKFPITLLLGRRAASNACSPEVVLAKGKRFGYFEEPNEGEKINVGLMKEYTGGDKITGRGLHKDPIEFKPQFKLVLLCNDLPSVPPDDEGTWRRLEVTEFKSKFCDNPQNPNEFKIDREISEKIKDWKELFISYLIDVYYNKYKKNGIKPPQDITKYTDEYQKQCDIYIDFIKNSIEFTDNESDSLCISEVHDEFKMWYSDNYNVNKIPSKVDFKKYLQKKYGKSKVTSTDIKFVIFKQKFQKQSINNSLSLINAF